MTCVAVFPLVTVSYLHKSFYCLQTYLVTQVKQRITQCQNDDCNLINLTTIPNICTFSFCQAQPKPSPAGAEIALLPANRAKCTCPPHQISIFESLLDYLGSWNLVWKLYSTMHRFCTNMAHFNGMEALASDPFWHWSKEPSSQSP